jgi:hypothetical protein
MNTNKSNQAASPGKCVEYDTCQLCGALKDEDHWIACEVCREEAEEVNRQWWEREEESLLNEADRLNDLAVERALWGTP